MITRRESKPAFTLNNYASRRDPFDFDSMFNFNEARRSTPDRFSFPVKKTVRNGDKCWHYQIQTQYVALEESTHTFGPVIFKGGIIETINASKQVSLKQVFAVGRSKNVRVVPPPEEDRPSSFVGAIGTNMIVDAALDAQNCRVGDPLTLTLTVSGGVNLKNIYAPDLSAQETLLKQFRLYEDTLATDRKTDSVSFSYTIRPTEAGTLEVPPISLSYFDSGARKYRTVRTSPIPVTAAEAGGIDSGMILGVDTNRQDALGQEQGGSLRYVAPFASHRSAAKDRGLGWHMAHLVLMLLSPAAFFTAMAARPALRVRRKLGKESERKGFYKDTVKALKKVSMLPADEASARIAALILSYVGRRSGENPNSLTPPDLSRLLDGSGLDDDSRSDLFRIASDHFNASFTHEARSKLDIRDDAAANRNPFDRFCPDGRRI
jgi:hypothetical protein